MMKGERELYKLFRATSCLKSSCREIANHELLRSSLIEASAWLAGNICTQKTENIHILVAKGQKIHAAIRYVHR